MKKIIVIIVAIALILISLGCSENNDNSDNYQGEYSTEITQEAAQPALTILDSKLVKEEYGGYSVTGTAKAGTDLSYAEVLAKFYDPDGSVIGSYIANTNNLKTGETWNFKIIGPVDNSVKVANYAIEEGDSF